MQFRSSCSSDRMSTPRSQRLSDWCDPCVKGRARMLSPPTELSAVGAPLLFIAGSIPNSGDNGLDATPPRLVNHCTSGAVGASSRTNDGGPVCQWPAAVPHTAPLHATPQRLTSRVGTAVPKRGEYSQLVGPSNADGSPHRQSRALLAVRRSPVWHGDGPTAHSSGGDPIVRVHDRAPVVVLSDGASAGVSSIASDFLHDGRGCSESVLSPPTMVLSPSDLTPTLDTAVTPVYSSFNTSSQDPRSIIASCLPPSGIFHQPSPIIVDEDEREALIAELRYARRQQEKQSVVLEHLRTLVGQQDAVRKADEPLSRQQLVAKLRLAWLIIISLPVKMGQQLVKLLCARLCAFAYGILRSV